MVFSQDLCVEWFFQEARLAFEPGLDSLRVPIR